MGYYSYDNGGRRGFMSNVPVAVKNIIIINVLVMIMTSLNENFMYEKFALFYPTSPFFHWWQPVTHMFMHGGFWHIFFNMYTLYIFGSVLERVWGTKKFLLFYFVTGIGAALIHSGAVMADGSCGRQHAGTGVHPYDEDDPYRGSIRCHIWCPDGICHAISGFDNDTCIPADFIESQVVRADIRWHRTPYRCHWHRRWNSSFRPSWRTYIRIPPYHVLEEETYALQQI